MIQIPSPKDKLFSQPNDSDTSGNLFATFNCDFDENKGNLRLGKRLVLNTSNLDVAEIAGFPCGFKVFEDGSNGEVVYTVSGTPNTGVGYVFKGGVDPTEPFVKMAVGGDPNGCDPYISDIDVFNNNLVVTPDGQNAYRLTSGSWSTINTGSTTNGFPRPLCTFGFGSNARQYSVIDSYRVISWDTSFSVASAGSPFTCDIDTGPNRSVITFLKASSNRIWIGTVNLVGGKGHIYEWDGSSTLVNKEYTLESSGALSCVIKDDIPYIIDVKGDLLYWNGGTFKKLTGFNKRNKKPFYNIASAKNNRFIHPNGMVLIKGQIHILVDLITNDVANRGGTQDICNPSGIYIYDESTKTLKHKYSFGLSKSGDTIKDYGQFKIYGAGALSEMFATRDYNTAIANGTFLAGASIYSDATTAKHGIFYDDNNDTLAKSGYLLTPKIFSSNIRDSWVRSFIKHKKFINNTDKITIKQRSVDDVFSEVTITWIDTNSFSYPDTTVGYAVGDEVEVIQGIGSGKCSNITAITHGSGVYLVTVDETYVGATGTSKAHLMKWIKAGIINDIKELGSANFAQGIGSTWIQIKALFSWTNANEMNELSIISKKLEPYE